MISQNPDIRFLGRLLGDVIRAYGGDKLFRQTEYIRSASVDRARGLEGAQKVDTGLGALSLDDTLSFVRGFMLFSMLANLAEDRQGAGGRYRRERCRGGGRAGAAWHRARSGDGDAAPRAHRAGADRAPD
jgi:phosphoenolpyruvate carboxylase